MQPKGQRLRRRLILYFIVLLFVLLAVMFSFLSFFGLLTDTETKTKNILDNYINEFSASVTQQYDNAAAHGIDLSKKLSAALSSKLSDLSYDFSELGDNLDAIASAESEMTPILIDSLAKAHASGVFFVMDTSVSSVNAELSQYKSGLYIKISNVNTANPVTPQLLLFRGAAQAARQNSIVLHNKWELEFQADWFPLFEKVRAEATPDLASSYYASEALAVPGTWETASYVAVPVFGQNSMFYGVCGFEISRIYFEHSHRMNAETFRISAVLAKLDELKIVAGSVLESGLYSGYLANIDDDTLTMQQAGSLTVYTNNETSFIGVEKPISLSPLEDNTKWFSAVMIPKADYDNEIREQVILTGLLILLIIVISVLASVLLAHRYVQPITEGINQIKQRGVNGFKPTKVPEIDDLMEYLNALDEEYKTVGEENENLAAELKLAKQRELDAQNSPAVSAYENFLKNLKTLTKTERAVFNYYMENLTAQEIAGKMFIALTTVKFHNKNIYAKLGVSSRKELMIYVNIMKEEQCGSGSTVS